jgi:ppGpp synthetase/RelA/SpoT-type nucleotidyltranferase
MKKKPSSNPLLDPEAAKELTDSEWAALHVLRFKQQRRRYEIYTHFLEKVLKAACQKLAPLCIISTRPKSLTSFAEKILRKRPLYMDPKFPYPPDPLARMTDLCGGRIITHTSAEVEKVCAFIKTAFDIDWPNSEDTSRRLKPMEFGYRSMHYIVTANAEKLHAAGVSQRMPASIAGLRAEIQVRTLLEHASADIGHDTLYKPAMRVPEPIQRQFAQVAAVLEGTDREFGRLLNDLNDLRSHQGAWHSPEDILREIERLRIVLRLEPRNEELAVRMGQLALDIGSHAEVLTVLKPFQRSHNPSIEHLRGIALTEMYWGSPDSSEFKKGIEALEAACAHASPDAETLCALAEAYARRDDDLRAGNMFQKALLADHTEPLSLCRFLEFEVARQSTDATVRLAEPLIHRSMDRCRREISAGVNLPVAWSSLAVFQLLTGSPYDAMESLAQVTLLCARCVVAKGKTPPHCAPRRAVLRTRETIRHLSCIHEKLEGFEWFERLLILALAVKVKDAEATETLGRLASWKSAEPYFKTDSNAVIISGGCVPAVQTAVNSLRPHLRRAFEGLERTLLGGGTRSGVSGLVSEIAASSQGRISAIGYVPASLPIRVFADTKRFAKLVQTEGPDFTPLEPLQGWTDLLAAEVDPANVKLLSFAGAEFPKWNTPLPWHWAHALVLLSRTSFRRSAGQLIPSGRIIPASCACRWTQ